MSHAPPPSPPPHAPTARRGSPGRPRGWSWWQAACSLLGVLLACSGLGGCQGNSKEAQKLAFATVERLLPLVERDTKQVRDGLPEGAKKIAPLLDDEPGADLASLQRAIQKARAGVESLTFAKSTFFVFVDPKGSVLRSEADPDLAAGEVLTKAIPDMSKLAEPGAGMLEAFGNVHGLRGVQSGPDLQWVVGHPVVDAAGKVKGSFVTGWSLRSYAHYLEEDTRRYLIKSSGDKPRAIPLVYVFLVRGTEAFGAPVTPDVNAEAVAKLDVASKAAAGSFQTRVEVEGRSFLLVAKPCPALGKDVALALLLSEV